MRTKKWILLIMAPVLVCLIFGCGKVKEEAESLLPSKADNPFVKEFDQQLAEIKDQPSAEKAVGTFVDYVDSRLIKDRVSAQSIRTFGGRDVVKELAAKELACRITSKIAALSATEYPSVEGEYTDVPEDYVPQVMPMSVADVSIKINNVAKEEGQYVPPEAIEQVKQQADEKIPHLSPDGAAFCTPLGALVTGYAAVSGDDGTKPAGSVEIPTARVNEFVNSVME